MITLTEATGKCSQLGEVIKVYGWEEQIVSCSRYGSGHINDTFLADCRRDGEGKRYILQRINHEIFTDVESLMENVSGVTSYLRGVIEKEGGDPDRETLNLVPNQEGGLYYKDTSGCYWRAYKFIEGATTYDRVEKPEDFYESAEAFGHFQNLLADYPVEKLSETIPDFHNTPKRYRDFCQAVEEDKCGRASSVAEEINFVRERAEKMGIVMDQLKNGEIPYRVTHNDTKLNNIMIDDTTGKAICVIDLDTIMPGASVFDYGDSIRFGANTAAEDETDLSKVSLSIMLFETYTKGFLKGCAGSLTEAETELLPRGAWMMTLECGMRFLTDYLQGDTYFKVHRPGHNLDRCRCQFALVSDMEAKWEQMAQIVRNSR